MRTGTLDILDSLIEINMQRVLDYEQALVELKGEQCADKRSLFENLAKESQLYKRALDNPYSAL